LPIIDAGRWPRWRTGAAHSIIAAMAGSIWTIEFFSCPKCALPYSATKEQHASKRYGSFSCEICGSEVHSWSGNHDFFGWKVGQSEPPVFGKRWA
jgi:hypothetical protein